MKQLTPSEALIHAIKSKIDELKRWGLWWESMAEYPEGEFIKYEDVIEILNDLLGED